MFRQDRRRLPLDTFAVRGTVTRDELELKEVAITSPLLEWRGALRIKTETPLQLTVDGKGSVGLGIARLLEPDLPVELGGRVAVSGQAVVRDGALAGLAAELSAPALAVNQVALTGLFVRAGIRNGEVATDQFQFYLDGGGAVTGQLGYSLRSGAVFYTGKLPASIELTGSSPGRHRPPVDKPTTATGTLSLQRRRGAVDPVGRRDGRPVVRCRPGFIITGLNSSRAGVRRRLRRAGQRDRGHAHSGQEPGEGRRAVGGSPARIWVPAKRRKYTIARGPASISGQEAGSKAGHAQIYGQTGDLPARFISGSFPDVDGALSAGRTGISGGVAGGTSAPFGSIGTPCG